MWEFIKIALSEEGKYPSTKRIIAFVGSMVIFIKTLYTPTEALIDASTLIICTALGAIGVVNVLKKNGNRINNNNANLNGEDK